MCSCGKEFYQDTPFWSQRWAAHARNCDGKREKSSLEKSSPQSTKKKAELTRICSECQDQRFSHHLTVVGYLHTLFHVIPAKHLTTGFATRRSTSFSLMNVCQLGDAQRADPAPLATRLDQLIVSPRRLSPSYLILLRDLSIRKVLFPGLPSPPAPVSH